MHCRFNSGKKQRYSISIQTILYNVTSFSQTGDNSSTDEKKKEPTTDTSTQMTEISSGFHILEIDMVSMGTGMGMLLLVGAAVLALQWWVQRWHAKKLWLQGGFHSQAFKTGCRCHPLRPYFPPASLLWMRGGGGGEAGSRFKELPAGAAGPPFPPPLRHTGRGLAPPLPPVDEDALEGGPALGRC